MCANVVMTHYVLRFFETTDSGEPDRFRGFGPEKSKLQ